MSRMDGWINSKVLEWNSWLGSRNDCELSVKTRAYEHWHHADRLLGLAHDPFHRSDLIGSLKRAIDHRLSQLDKLYKWDRIALPGMPRGKRRLEQLEYLGVVRKSMVKQIIDIRNNIEHKDAKPPGLNRCSEMVEFVWYFLRSTDILVSHVGQDVAFERHAGDIATNVHWMEIETGPNSKWEIGIRACIPKGDYSSIDVAGWIHVRSKSFSTRGQLITQNGSRWDKETLESQHSEDPNDVFFNGKVFGPDSQKLQLFRKYLSLA